MRNKPRILNTQTLAKTRLFHIEQRSEAGSPAFPYSLKGGLLGAPVKIRMIEKTPIGQESIMVFVSALRRLHPCLFAAYRLENTSNFVPRFPSISRPSCGKALIASDLALETSFDNDQQKADFVEDGLA